MKFKIDKVSNCDINNSLMKNEIFKQFALKNGLQAGKKILSIFCCLCCCVDNPSASLIFQYADKLGVPPRDLAIIEDNETPNHVVISYVGKNADGVEEKTPLIFTDDISIAKAIISELSQIYITSSQMNVLGSGPSLDELDNKASAWNQVFGLPSKSKGTQQLEFNGTLRPGQSIFEAAQNYRAPEYVVRTLAQANTSAEHNRTNVSMN